MAIGRRSTDLKRSIRRRLLVGSNGIAIKRRNAQVIGSNPIVGSSKIRVFESRPSSKTPPLGAPLGHRSDSPTRLQSRPLKRAPIRPDRDSRSGARSKYPQPAGLYLMKRGRTPFDIETANYFEKTTESVLVPTSRTSLLSTKCQAVRDEGRHSDYTDRMNRHLCSNRGPWGLQARSNVAPPLYDVEAFKTGTRAARAVLDAAMRPAESFGVARNVLLVPDSASQGTIHQCRESLPYFDPLLPRRHW